MTSQVAIRAESSSRRRIARLAVPVLGLLVLSAISCRGGVGTGDSTTILFQTATVTPLFCMNDIYPPEAPEFGDDSSFAYTFGAYGLGVFEHVFGEGEFQVDSNNVHVVSTGWLEDGCIFDSSRIRSAPTIFSVGGLISGMNEGIKGMKPGGRRRLHIPSNIGYGGQEIPGVIPADSTLIFDVELVEIDPVAEVAATPVRACQNDFYPQDAPPFGDDSAVAYETLESGLSIFDHVVGTGVMPDPTSLVIVHYTGWLDDGCIFDSSRTLPDPAEFNLDGLIAGMQEGIEGMQVGGHRRIKIPSELGYGAEPRGNLIPANATLIFDVELIEIDPLR